MSEFKTSFKTTWVILAVALLLGAWDIWARSSPGGTISEVILSSARQSPLLPFLFGVLCGHLFWPQQVTKS